MSIWLEGINIMAKENEVEKSTVAYAAPILTVYGSMTELTASGSSGKNESNGHPDGGPSQP
jgi:hypothetical protein